jgi:hypothetical protein
VPGAIVIDGANVIANSGSRPAARLELALAWAHNWRGELPVKVFVDHSTWLRCRPGVREQVEALAEITPPGESADTAVLEAAGAARGVVLSNDRFWDHVELRSNVYLVQFSLSRGELRVSDHATWFPSTHGAAFRVDLEYLRTLGC